MTRRPSREATLRAIGITVVVAIGVVFLLGLWVGHTYGTLDPLVPPPKLNVFGRDYRSSQNKPSTRAGVLATRAVLPRTSSSRRSAPGRSCRSGSARRQGTLRRRSSGCTSDPTRTSRTR